MCIAGFSYLWMMSVLRECSDQVIAASECRTLRYLKKSLLGMLYFSLRSWKVQRYPLGGISPIVVALALVQEDRDRSEHRISSGVRRKISAASFESPFVC